MYRATVVIIALLLTTAVAGQELKTEIVDGGSVLTDLGYNVQVNKGSTLKRSFAIVNDPAAPAQLSGAGVVTRYGRDRYSFGPTGTLTPVEDLAAVEVRVVLYDVFGSRIKTLTGTHITDMPVGTTVNLSDIGSWYASENQASELLTAVTFIANARTKSGKVWRANEKKVADELAKLDVKVTSGALEPTKDERQP